VGDVGVGILGRVAENIGCFAFFVLLLWKLLDKWAARFLGAQELQASAMTALASAVKDSTGEQREVLLALRVLATKQDEALQWTKEIAANYARMEMRSAPGRGAA
jgi:hypothetical protein